MEGIGTGGACAGVPRGARTRDEDRAGSTRRGTPWRRVRRPAHEHRRFGSGAPAVSWPCMHVLSAFRATGEAEETNSQPVISYTLVGHCLNKCVATISSARQGRTIIEGLEEVWCWNLHRPVKGGQHGQARW